MEKTKIKTEILIHTKVLVIDVFPCNRSKVVTQSRDPDNGRVADIVYSKSMGNAVLEASHIKL